MSKNTDEKTISDLQTLGLSEKEAAVYLALLPHRDMGTSKIARATSLHGQFVYDALEKLERRGLAKHVIRGGRRKFSAVSPSRLLSLAEEKKLLAQSLSRKLQGAFSGEHEQDFEVFQGEVSFVAHELEEMRSAKEGDFIDVIGGAGDRFLQSLGEATAEYEALRIRKKILVRYLGAQEQQSDLERRRRDLELFEFRIFPGLSSGQVNTDVRQNSVTLNIFGSPLLSFHLKSPAAARGYKEFFESLWKRADSV